MFVIGAIGILIQAASAVQVSVEPSIQTVSEGDYFTVNISVNPEGSEVFAAQYELHFNNSLLRVISQDKGPFLGDAGVSLLKNEINNPLGCVKYGETRTVLPAVTDPGVLASIEFKARSSGTSELNFTVAKLSDPSLNPISTNSNNGTVEIGDPQPSSPFFIYGYVVYDDDSDCNNPIINVTNLNTNKEWQANTDETSNYYQHMLRHGVDILAGETLQFNVTKGSQTVIQTHEVTQSEINVGGLFNFNVTLQTEGHPQVWYFTQAENTTVNAPYANDGWVHDKDLVMNKTKPAEGTYCILEGGKALWFYATTGAQTDLSFGENNWTAKIFTSDPDDKAGNTTTVDVCKITPGGVVTVIASGSVPLIANETEYDITCVHSTTQNFNTGDWLGVRVSWSGPASEKIRVYYNPTGDKNSYVKSPSADPGYPIPELSTLILFSSGLLALAGYALKKRKSNRDE
ncbi:Cohesin domain-containing protein [Candidatus Methanophagaceae archaeon]|nr:Cohesin domain-containing protein [Methanophagales archaeon]